MALTLHRVGVAGLAFGAVLVWVTPRAAADAPTPFDAAAWQEDYAHLKSQLEAQYANLAWYGSPEGHLDLPRHDRFTQKALQLAETDDQARWVLRTFIDGFHDGHLTMAGRATAPGSAVKDPPPPAIEQMDAAAACAAIGVASSSRIPFSLPFESLNGFTLESDGMIDSFRSGVLTTEGNVKIGVVRIPRFREMEHPGLCTHAWYKVRTADGPVFARRLRDALTDAWGEVLSRRLKRLRERGAVALVVDVGGNAGGNDVGDWSGRLFTPNPVHSSTLLMAAGPLADAYLDEQLTNLRKALAELTNVKSAMRPQLQRAIADFETRKAGMAARACDLSWVWKEQRPWQPRGCSRLVDVGFFSGPHDHLPPAAKTDAAASAALYWPARFDGYRGAWSGPVYLLTDSGVGSAAEGFVALMHDNGIARTIGARTGGSACGNMQEARMIVLPHSKLKIHAPDCVRLRADGTNEVMGIVPDLPVLPTAGEGDRARAARVVTTVELDLKKAAAGK